MKKPPVKRKPKPKRKPKGECPHGLSLKVQCPHCLQDEYETLPAPYGRER